MTTTRLRPLVATMIALAAFTALAAFAPPRPQTPAPITRLVAARPFVLDQPYTFKWRAERPAVDAGYLVVLAVDPALVYPRQTAEPVLFVDRTTAQRFNVGHTSGRVVAIVPSALDDAGKMTLDLSKAAIWFGAPALPEAIDQGQIDAERVTATRVGIRPTAEREVQRAFAAESDKPLHLANERDLYAAAAQLVLRYAPDEQELAHGWLNVDTP